jgi:hypothetical protein
MAVDLYLSALIKRPNRAGVMLSALLTFEARLSFPGLPIAINT